MQRQSLIWRFQDFDFLSILAFSDLNYAEKPALIYFIVQEFAN